MSVNYEEEEEEIRAGEVGKLQVVEFLLGDECFAIDLFDVKEVVEYMSITSLPDTPDFIRGIIDLRGEITTIVDLRERLGIDKEKVQPDEECRIIVLDEKHTDAKKIGIMVDDVLSVTTYDMKQVDTSTTRGNDSAVLGIIKKKVKSTDKEKAKSELIIWVDIRKLVSEINEYLT